MIGAALRHQEVSNPLADRRNTKGMATAIPFVFGRDDRIRTCDFYVPKMENNVNYKVFYEYCTKNLTLLQRI